MVAETPLAISAKRECIKSGTMRPIMKVRRAARLRATPFGLVVEFLDAGQHTAAGFGSDIGTTPHDLGDCHHTDIEIARDVLQTYRRGGNVSHVDSGAGRRRRMRCKPSEGEYTKLRRAPASLARMDVCGGMVKLVYTEALKASSPQGECGFDSHSRYQTPSGLQ